MLLSWGFPIRTCAGQRSFGSSPHSFVAFFRPSSPACPKASISCPKSLIALSPLHSSFPFSKLDFSIPKSSPENVNQSFFSAISIVFFPQQFRPSFKKIVYLMYSNLIMNQSTHSRGFINSLILHILLSKITYPKLTVFRSPLRALRNSRLLS